MGVDEEEAHRGWKRRNDTVEDLSSWFCQLSTQERLQVSAHWLRCKGREAWSQVQFSVWGLLLIHLCLVNALQSARVACSRAFAAAGWLLSGLSRLEELAVLVVASDFGLKFHRHSHTHDEITHVVGDEPLLLLSFGPFHEREPCCETPPSPPPGSSFRPSNVCSIEPASFCSSAPSSWDGALRIAGRPEKKKDREHKPPQFTHEIIPPTPPRFQNNKPSRPLRPRE